MRSPLRLSLAANGEVSPADPAFLRAVHEALDDPAMLSEALFGVRAGGLLGYISAEDARWTWYDTQPGEFSGLEITEYSVPAALCQAVFQPRDRAFPPAGSR